MPLVADHLRYGHIVVDDLQRAEAEIAHVQRVARIFPAALPTFQSFNKSHRMLPPLVVVLIPEASAGSLSARIGSLRVVRVVIVPEAAIGWQPNGYAGNLQRRSRNACEWELSHSGALPVMVPATGHRPSASEV